MSNLEGENAFNSTQCTPAEHLARTDVLLSSRGWKSVCVRLRALSQAHPQAGQTARTQVASLTGIHSWIKRREQGLIMGQ